jgi:hypothetical protein
MPSVLQPYDILSLVERNQWPAYLVFINTSENYRRIARLQSHSETRHGLGDDEPTLEGAPWPKVALLETAIIGEVRLVVEFVGEEWAGYVMSCCQLYPTDLVGRLAQYPSQSTLLPIPGRSVQCGLWDGVAQWIGCPLSSTRLGLAVICRFQQEAPWPESCCSGSGQRPEHRGPRARTRRAAAR